MSAISITLHRTFSDADSGGAVVWALSEMPEMPS